MLCPVVLTWSALADVWSFLTIDIALDKLYSLSDPPTLSLSVLQKLLEFATKKSHSLFAGQYYDQIDGVAMGSPLGPVLANIFMCHFEEKWVMSGQVCPSFWYRYVDDTFTMFENKDTANGFLQTVVTTVSNLPLNLNGTMKFHF